MKTNTKIHQIDTSAFQIGIAEQKKIDNSFTGKKVNLSEKITEIKLNVKTNK